ncbi:PEP/pyruvate-binding domain-containing protein [Halobacteriovorax sp.]|uniref:PEP/pyruvate-binding domain-containing protein n=1 Tax=Halobacteriovorax sp. TaxID=2020862 RepID=UPI0035684831
MILDFRELKESQQFVGSKAYVLAMMTQAGLPVPAGMILTDIPEGEDEWTRVVNWWKEQEMAPLAVRSSAFGEDSEEMSFAGQNQTFLEIKSIEELKDAINSCFKSVDREASQSYRQFFMGEKKDIPMNVVLQVMVKARYAGVYFSVNPTHAEEGSVLEYIEGLGESLVSGQVNPYRNLKSSQVVDGPLSREDLNKVFKMGELVEEKLGQKIDMEWAVDDCLNAFLLQARPITSARSETKQKKILEAELKRIHEEYPEDTWWDGQTFAEWTGQPSRLTYEVWKRAFAPVGAFDDALHELGYIGFNDESYSPHESIMDRIFGRGFINMNKMVPLYFGPIPYRIAPLPKAHLKFEWHKITAIGVLNTPKSLWRMVRVGWNMSTNRRSWIERSRKELVDFKHKLQRPQDGDLYSDWKYEEVLNLWEKEIANFSKVSLKWPLVLVVLIEASMQSLRAVLSSVVGKDKVEEHLQQWMGAGLETATFEMNRYFSRALEEPLKREFFFSRFGHRGPGELDLSNPRWQELGETAFGTGKSVEVSDRASLNIEDEIHKLKTFKDVVLIEEWKILKELLELREQWKMEILRPYAHIRYISLELGKRLGVGNEIFHLTVEEVIALSNGQSVESIKDKIKIRKEELDAYKGIYLPDVLKQSDVEDCLKPIDMGQSSLRGTPLSSGVVKGIVKIVNDPSDVDFTNWPGNTVLVAPATDPGWTALFTRCSGVIVERGGVLSHCAILARELGLPSINLPKATHLLKDGDSIWLDGHSGGVKNDNIH